LTESARVASTLVRETIERDGVVSQGLARGLINVRALARSIQVANPKASFDAVLSAIRRYPISDISSKRQSISKMILKLSMKNNVAVLSMRNQLGVQMAIAQFAREVDYDQGQTFRVVSGTEIVSVTIDSKNIGKLESKMPKGHIRKRIGNLAELVVDMISDTENTSGVLSTITTELKINDINIAQLSTVGPGRVTILVDAKDATKVYLSVASLSKSK